ncbi:hypothetical protein [Alicyclobacillus sp. ALC3]|uniref:hypothetical protein n=1 Tax=Alicyclobacillus sp. ALC3 TaxID=2796143 RepID=UPI0023789585|nr:hypothetical protein [Alicyclobacillus sp. ALC3]WDL96066.1 hypothetical protein JC200_17225 [Alicyclobacillus sp. ALC3]
MIVVAVIFSICAVGFGIMAKVTAREWGLKIGLLALALLGSTMVSWNVWPEVDLLVWVKWLFEPATKWFYSVL